MKIKLKNIKECSIELWCDDKYIGVIIKEDGDFCFELDELLLFIEATTNDSQ